MIRNVNTIQSMVFLSIMSNFGKSSSFCNIIDIRPKITFHFKMKQVINKRILITETFFASFSMHDAMSAITVKNIWKLIFNHIKNKSISFRIFGSSNNNSNNLYMKLTINSCAINKMDIFF